jgi:hypothetical protein
MSAGRNFIAPEAKAAMGLALLKEAILEHLDGRPGGVGNHELAVELGLGSSHEGRQQDYLIYSVLGILKKARASGKFAGAARSTTYQAQARSGPGHKSSASTIAGRLGRWRSLKAVRLLPGGDRVAGRSDEMA